MLREIVTENRLEIITRCGARVAARMTPTSAEAMRGVPVFLDQFVEALRVRHHGGDPVIMRGAQHGAELLRLGFSLGQVVGEYGDICQVITALAIERGKVITIDDFQLLNLCLDDAIASAVTEYGRQRELDVAAISRDRATEDLGILSHELHTLAWSATLAFDALKTGSVGVSGSTGAVITRSLASLGTLVDRSFRGPGPGPRADLARPARRHGQVVRRGGGHDARRAHERGAPGGRGRGRGGSTNPHADRRQARAERLRAHAAARPRRRAWRGD